MAATKKTTAKKPTVKPKPEKVEKVPVKKAATKKTVKAKATPKKETKPTTVKKATTKKVPEKKTEPKKVTKKKVATKPQAVEKVPVKTKAELLCENVAPELRTQVISLANAVLTMQDKIEQQIPIYKNEPLAQMVTLGSGETTLRPNPIVQEFRATVRDYATALENLKKILDAKATASEVSAVEALRNRFKVG